MWKEGPGKCVKERELQTGIEAVVVKCQPPAKPCQRRNNAIEQCRSSSIFDKDQAATYVSTTVSVLAIPLVI
jgi:hypothetical protein